MKNKDIISKMTLEEKASFMSGKDFWTTMDLKKYDIPSIFLSDGPHGLRKQAAAADHLGLNAGVPATCFPTSATVANSWDEKLGEEMATYLGKEAASLDVNVLLGPGTNIKRNPLCGRNFEYFSEDPLLAGKMSAAYVRGIQSTGVSACLKHFAANNQEFRRMVIDSIIDERTLREIYLKPFEIGIKEGNLKCLMSSYNMVNGTHTNENIHLMRDILRDEWNYQGMVVTDWGGSNDRVKGLIAGNSLEMPTTGGETNEEIIKAVKSGEISEDVLDENLDRLLNLVFDTSKAVNASKESFDKEKHHLMAQKVAEESMVLLKNDNALPLNNKEKVAVIGDFAKTPRYQGAGSSIVNPTKLDNTIDVIADFDINYIGFEPGYNRYGKKSNSLIKKALKLAEQAETILLYIGLDEFSEVEGLDRKDMLIPSNQLELFNNLKTLKKKIVVVLACGSAIEMDFADDANAILHTYLSGQAGAKAALNILTGKINPSGKLSETHPFKYEDTPTAKYFPGKEVTAEYKEGLYVGYRYFDTNNVKVRYPFGYGLSYTSFEYSDLEVNKNEVTFKIKNTGKFSGKEIAQVYVKATNSKVYRPEKELKGFVKVDLKANETKTVSVKLGEDAFKFFNPDSMKWEVEKLQYEILVGASSTDIRLKSKLDVDGINIKTTLDLKDIPSYKSGKIQDVTTAEFEKILGREVPKSTYNFYKKNRLVVGYNTTVDQLRYSRRWVGRAFSGGIRFAIKLLHGLGKREAANTLAMGVVHLPMRGMAHMSGGAISWGQLDGLIMMFNGHFFKGFGKFLKEGRIKSKKRKMLKKEEKSNE
ncbi:MAG: glycoside hydrolase family 3 C-terminal domain-containing protein [Candidatus Izemoplasmatales bacterium]|jgi:beta-glucosidase|nr:glycoside hydrolase family 3 C-terminal domain-containing protein [Candidatus Izemoplasmatales bacterium]